MASGSWLGCRSRPIYIYTYIYIFKYIYIHIYIYIYIYIEWLIVVNIYIYIYDYIQYSCTIYIEPSLTSSGAFKNKVQLRGCPLSLRGTSDCTEPKTASRFASPRDGDFPMVLVVLGFNQTMFGCEIFGLIPHNFLVYICLLGLNITSR